MLWFWDICRKFACGFDSIKNWWHSKDTQYTIIHDEYYISDGELWDDN